MAQNRVMSFTIPCGRGGLNRQENYVEFPIEDLAWAEGLTVEHLAWEKELGAVSFNVAELPGVTLAIHDFHHGTAFGTQELVVALNTGFILHLDTAGAVTKTYSTANALTQAWFVEGVYNSTLRSLFCFTFERTPRYYREPFDDWVSFQSGDMPDEWTGSAHPHFGFSHNFRLLCATKTSSLLYMSNPLNHQQFKSTVPNTRIMDIFTGDGQYIAAGTSWRGRAYLFKYPMGVYVLDDADPNLANWSVRKLTGAFGVMGPGCVVDVEDDVIVLGADGYFYSLSTVQTLGQVSVEPILPQELSEWVRSHINLNRLDLVRSTYFARKRQIWWALPATGVSTNRRRLIMDLAMPGKIRLHWSTRDTMMAVATRRTGGNTQQPMWASDNPHIWIGDQAARGKNAFAYTGQFETPPFALFPLAEREANLKELQVTFKPEGEYDLSLEVHRDDTLSQTLTLSQQSTGSPSGSFSLDSEVTGGTVIATTSHRLEGSAKRVKLIGKNAELNETFAVQAFTLRMTPGSHTV